MIESAVLTRGATIVLLLPIGGIDLLLAVSDWLNPLKKHCTPLELVSKSLCYKDFALLFRSSQAYQKPADFNVFNVGRISWHVASLESKQEDIFSRSALRPFK